jgi:hypothetical protein
MAYLRGDYYIWGDSDDYLHLWAADGYDGWDEAGWATIDPYENPEMLDGEIDGETVLPRAPDRLNASGVCLPLNVIDQFVMMRLAQLIKEDRVRETVERAISENGNYGGQVLETNAEIIINTLSSLKLK